MTTSDGIASKGAASEAQALPGEVIAGKYLITRVIGRGGMGVVVEAKHLGLDDRVAIKILHRRYIDNAEALARFHLEAKAAVRIRGEHSARLLDVGTTELGEPFMVMELLTGSDLATIVRAARLSVEEAVLYILQACEGIAEVHANGIIHRDLKPGNLFVTRRPDGTPLVKVLDFGIAKSVAPADEGDWWALTMTMVALGTPLYMSPEQIRSSRDVDARTDIWSLGVILYELLAGKPPFAGSTVAGITMQVLEAHPEHLRDLRDDVTPELDRVIARAMAKKADNRFGDVAAFAAALAPFAGDAGRDHARRAMRILRGEGKGVGATPFHEDTNAPLTAHDTMADTDLGATARRRERSHRARIPLPFALAIACVVLSTALLGLRTRATVKAAAMRGIASACMGAATRAALSLAEQSNEAAKAAASAPIGVSVKVDDLPIVPPATTAPKATPARRAIASQRASDDDALSTRK